MAHRGHTPSCLWTFQGSWQDTVKAKVTSPSSQASPAPAQSPHPMLALLKKEESKVSAPSTASSSRKLG